MTKIALFGAGGEMGIRLGLNLSHNDDFETMHVEVSQAGRQRVYEALGVQCVEVDDALEDADVIVLAVPDNLKGVFIDWFKDSFIIS